VSELAEKTILVTNLPGAESRRSGKVRDIYEFGDNLLIVATDRISCFDCVMPNGIPGKGKILTALSEFWFERTGHVVPNHMISTRLEDFPETLAQFGDVLEGRAMWVRKAKIIPVECVVRGYLTGSAWQSYQETGEMCGHKLPAGLREADELPAPIFTPATKSPAGHDENITREEMAKITGERLAQDLTEESLKLYEFGAAYAAERGVILADAKFEFGLTNGDLILADEVFTPDASRYWDVGQYQPGRPQQPLDKQYVRDYLNSLDWDKQSPAPELPPEVVARTRQIYQETMRRLTGQSA
jgi:phosphoribosylaminoimidazole-succinocarboxamide synthase